MQSLYQSSEMSSPAVMLGGMATRTYSRRRGSPASVDLVLDAAERLIRENAFHSATMDELAAAAGVSRATVFNRFGSKLGVLQALYTRCIESPEMEAIREALAIEDPVVALEALIEATCAMWEAHGFIQEQLQAIVVLEPDGRARRAAEGRTARRPSGSGAALGSGRSAASRTRRGPSHRDAPHADQPGVLRLAAPRVRPFTAADPQHDRRTRATTSPQLIESLAEERCPPLRAAGGRAPHGPVRAWLATTAPHHPARPGSSVDPSA